MHSDDHGPKWTATERKMLELVREFEGSGMRWVEFARSQGMTPARFSWWKSHLLVGAIKRVILGGGRAAARGRGVSG